MPTSSSASPWKLSPSDLTFLWDECPRCFYLKVVHGFNRPASAFPKIFSRIDKLMKDFFEGQPTMSISASLPDGRVRFGEKWVTSQPITTHYHAATSYIRGKFDTAVEFDDGTFGVVDFKTSEPRPEHVPFYSRQLHAYTYALEHPASGSFSLAPISRLGLLCVEPVLMERAASGHLAYLGEVTWLEIPRDDAWFLDFIGDILAVLESPLPPPAGLSCSYCQYRVDARQRGV